MKEIELQTACMDYVRLMRNVDERFKLVWHPPNGGKKPSWQGVKSRREGMTKGVSDIIVQCPSHDGQFHGASLELKSQKGKLTKEQKEYLEVSSKYGNLAAVIRSTSEFVDLINSYMGVG